MRIKKFEKYDRLEVAWIDIVERSGWRSVAAAETEGGAKVNNIGYFLGNHKGILNLASSLSEDGDCNVTSIPWGVITEIKQLRITTDGEC